MMLAVDGNQRSVPRLEQYIHGRVSARSARATALSACENARTARLRAALVTGQHAQHPQMARDVLETARLQDQHRETRACRSRSTSDPAIAAAPGQHQIRSAMPGCARSRAPAASPTSARARASWRKIAATHLAHQPLPAPAANTSSVRCGASEMTRCAGEAQAQDDAAIVDDLDAPLRRPAQQKKRRKRRHRRKTAWRRIGSAGALSAPCSGAGWNWSGAGAATAGSPA